MKRLLLISLFLFPPAHAQELPWLTLGGGELEHVDTQTTTNYAHFGFGVPARNGEPLAVELALWHFDDRNGLADPQALSFDLMPFLDLGPLRVFLRGGPAFTKTSAGWSYGGGLEFPMFRGSTYQWKLRADWRRFTDRGNLTENGPVEATTVNLVVAH